MEMTTRDTIIDVHDFVEKASLIIIQLNWKHRIQFMF